MSSSDKMGGISEKAVGAGGDHPWRGRRLVAVFAHPDDESYGPAGTVARYVAQGAEAHLICATRGEAGSMGPTAGYDPSRLGAIRAGELRLAAQVIGYASVHILGYPDGAVAGVEEERGVGEVGAILEELRPDAVLAFHPLGISGHPDHRTMTRFAAAAVARLRSESGRRIGLHYYTVPASVVRELEFSHMPLVEDAEIHVEIDTSAFVDVKRRAIQCHHSQLVFYRRLTAQRGHAERFARELFTTEGVDGAIRRRLHELL